MDRSGRQLDTWIWVWILKGSLCRRYEFGKTDMVFHAMELGEIPRGVNTDGTRKRYKD